MGSIEESTDTIIAGWQSFHERLAALERREPNLHAYQHRATGAVVEIIEYSNERNDLGVIIPNSVSINGQELLLSADHPVIVHETELQAQGAVLVTLTLFARRVVIEQRDVQAD